jgi:hypothetical protein
MPARKLILKGMVFVFMNLIILAGVLSFCSGRHRDIRFNNWDTESNLLVMGENEHYDILLLGTSRGRVFARDGNHLMLEDMIGKKVINLSKGGGGGLMPAELHLSHFFDRGNTTDHIVYLVDVWVFFSAINNENNNFFLRDEPFELSIFWKLILDRYPLERICAYLQMIAVTDWKTISSYKAPGLTEKTLKHMDPEKLIKARAHYLSRYREDNFEKYSRVVHTINALAQKHNSRITYVLLPILIPDFPGVAQVDRKLKKAAARKDHVAYYNLVGTMHDRQFFYDHMHFNKTGIAYFTQNYLGPIIQKAETSNR